MQHFSYSASSHLADQLEEVRNYLDSNKTSAVVAHVYSGYTDRAAIQPVLDTLQEALPEAIVVGSTAAGEICEGVSAPKSIVVVVTVFETASVEVRSFRIGPGEERACGEAVRGVIDSTANVKAAELLVDCAGISSADVFAAVGQCAPHVEVFGAVPYAHALDESMFVFTGDCSQETTLILLTYAGEDFHIACDHVIGWKPMGIGLKVTKAEGGLLNELNGKSALEVYTKYLQIPNDENFYDNAFEFPFLRYVNDTYMMRHPHAGLPDGSIELRAPVEVGDTMYLSYGDIPTIASEVLEARGRMERFRPQFICMHNCAARKAFWGNEIHREIAPFQNVAGTSGFFTGGEILRVNGEIVHFNTTCVVAGMREGAPDEASAPLGPATAVQDDFNMQQASMVRRMACFINVAMEELLESNRQLDVLARTDELTSLYNRREMGHMIEGFHDAGIPFCLIMADLDDFKKVNDTYGHDAGDVVLQDAANLIRESAEGVDDAAAGRWGGEEFMVLLPRTSLEDACDIAEALRHRIEAFPFEAVKALTVSLGVADSKTYEDMKSIYHDVDQALYAAKAAGKNDVVVACASAV